MELYLGLMSGTSADGIDAAVVDFSAQFPHVVATAYTPYTAELREKILSLYQPGENEIHRLSELDVQLGQIFAAAANKLLQEHTIAPQTIRAIGSHGQTVRHHPHQPLPFTLQIGDPNIIAAATGITTVADFRRRDIAFGGQGAPLVPAFHQHLFTSSKMNRVIVNIGGIANATFLPHDPKQPIIGFDTGPGNALMDAWIHTHQQKMFDHDGRWAASGYASTLLLENLLKEPYFHQPAPKSTGREYFNLNWLNQHLQKINQKISPVDVQATLAELTVRTIILSIRTHLPHGEILVCGGGARNSLLMSHLQALAKPHFTIETTEKYGVDPDWVEAMAFAWLAKQTLNGKPGNLPSVTGAQSPCVLGGIYYN
jgi:anhydro-N-acetylmuramic acid kinase